MKYLLNILFLSSSCFSISQIKGETKSFDLNSNELIVEKPLPPFLTISEVLFVDENNNNTIESLEKSKIKFKVTNSGKGSSRGLNATIKNLNSLINGLIFNKSLSLGNLAPNSSKVFEIPFEGTLELTSGKANIEINFTEKTGLPPDLVKINIPTKAFDSPRIEVVDYSFLSDKGQLSLGIPLQLKVLVQNTGQGIGENINLQFSCPNLAMAISEEKFNIPFLKPGENKDIVFEFIVPKTYLEKNITITAKLNEKYGRFANNKDFTVAINSGTNSNINISLESTAITNKVSIERASLTSDIDKNIPVNQLKNTNRYALIIGNEDYVSYQTGLSTESNVVFARNDAEAFKNYALNSFGIEENHITILKDATSSQIKKEINRHQEILNLLKGQGELIFYYAGHGLPDEVTKIPYIIPVDVTASNLTDGINLFNMYKLLVNGNPKKVTVFLDACFSGGGRDAGLIASRALKIKPRQEIINGNIVIFSSSNEEESSLPYKNKNHGMFTYQLLKKIQDSKGKLNYLELYNSVAEKVSLESLNVNKIKQTPQILFSEDIYGSWQNWRVD
jgi:hypothetical protein